MPMRTEHAARLKSPDAFETFRRQNNKGGQGVDFIFGIRSDGGSEIQAVRFDKKSFTPAAARKWLKEHDMSAIEFEPAKEMTENRSGAFHYESVLMNAASCGPIRTEELDGRKYLVAPMVMITEGVHQGSQGPLYYPPEELSKTPTVWNTKPIVVYHPKIDGAGVSACSPEILASRAVGMVMQTRYEDGKLKAEAWLDDEKIDRVDPRIRESIQTNRVMEVSTGLFTDNMPQQGEWRGERYTHIARNYRPDHLALLPDEKGACSTADGAGLLRNQAEGAEGRENRVYPLENKFASHAQRRAFFAKMGANKGGGSGGGGAKSGGAKGEGGGAKDRGKIVDRIKTTETALQKAEADLKLAGTRAATVKAMNLISTFRQRLDRLNQALNQTPGGKVKKHSIELPKDPKRLTIPQAGEALTEMGYKLGKPDYDLKTKKTSYEVTTPGGKTKKMTTDELKTLVYDSASKSPGLSKKPTVNELLANARRGYKSHNQLRQLLQQKLQQRFGSQNLIEDVYDDFVVYYNPTAEKRFRLGYTNTSDGCKLADESPQEVMVVIEYQTITGDYVANVSPPPLGEPVMKKDEIVSQLIANEAAAWDEEDRGFLEGLTDLQLGKLYVANIEATVPDPLLENEEEEEEEDEPIENEMNAALVTKTPVAKPAPAAKPQPKTLNEWMAEAPPEVQRLVANAQKLEGEQKKQYIEIITANERVQFSDEYLQSRSIDELQALAALAAPASSGPSWAGAATAAPVRNAASAIPESAVLPHPVMNFSEEAA